MRNDLSFNQPSHGSKEARDGDHEVTFYRQPETVGATLVTDTLTRKNNTSSEDGVPGILKVSAIANIQHHKYADLPNGAQEGPSSSCSPIRIIKPAFKKDQAHPRIKPAGTLRRKRDGDGKFNLRQMNSVTSLDSVRGLGLSSNSTSSIISFRIRAQNPFEKSQRLQIMNQKEAETDHYCPVHG